MNESPLTYTDYSVIGGYLMRTEVENGMVKDRIVMANVQEFVQRRVRSVEFFPWLGRYWRGMI